MADQGELIASDACAVVERLRNGEITPHDPHGPAVADNVVESQHQQVLGLSQPEQGRPEQRPDGQIEGPPHPCGG